MIVILKIISLLTNAALSLNLSGLGGNSGIFQQGSAGEKPMAVKFSQKVSVPFISAAALTSPISLEADYLSSTLVSPLQIGTPPQLFNVLFDTGSFVFWVRDKSCTNPGNCRNLPAFNQVASSTFTDIPSSSSTQQVLRYGDGTNVTCTIDQDVITVAGDSLPKSNICFASQILSSPPSTLDGIVGTGPKGNPQTGIAEFLPVFFAANPGLEEKMAFWYNTNLSVPSGGAGSITLGGVDSSKYTGNFKYFNVQSNANSQFWQLGLNAVATASGSIVANFNNVAAVVDTGTTVLLLDAVNAEKINSQIGALYDSESGAYILNCNSISTLPPLVFYFSDTSQPLVLSGNQLAFIDSKGGVCYSIAQSLGGLGINKIIIGAWFLKSFYTVFDYENSKIGFAQPTGQVSSNTSITIPNLSNGNSSSFFSNLSSTATILIIIGALAVVSLLIYACAYYRRQKNHPGVPEQRLPVHNEANMANSNSIPRMVQLFPQPPAFSEAPAFLNKLDRQSIEFTQVYSLFQNSWLAGNSQFGIPQVLSIFQVTAPDKLAERYFMTEAKLGYLGVERLFHGAPIACSLLQNTQQPCQLLNCAVCRIISQGFNPSSSTCRSRGSETSRFGKGMYFTSVASVANDYTIAVPPGHPQIIMLADVLPGKRFIPSTSLWTAECVQSLLLDGTDFDSVYAPAKSIEGLEVDEYVVGKSGQAIVRYLVEYAFPGHAQIED